VQLAVIGPQRPTLSAGQPIFVSNGVDYPTAHCPRICATSNIAKPELAPYALIYPRHCLSVTQCDKSPRVIRGTLEPDFLVGAFRDHFAGRTVAELQSMAIRCER